MLFVFKKMMVYLKCFLLNISLPPLPTTSMNSKNVYYSTDKLFFIQTCGIQSCVLVLLVVGWKPELMAALRELTDEPIRRGINTRKGNWPSAGPSVIPTWCSTAMCLIDPPIKVFENCVDETSQIQLGSQLRVLQSLNKGFIDWTPIWRHLLPSSFRLSEELRSFWM